MNLTKYFYLFDRFINIFFFRRNDSLMELSFLLQEHYFKNNIQIFNLCKHIPIQVRWIYIRYAPFTLSVNTKFRSVVSTNPSWFTSPP